MRILHVIASLSLRDGGPPKACVEMARAVARRGHEVALYTTHIAEDSAAETALTPEQAARDGLILRSFPRHFPKGWSASFGLGRALKQDIPGFDLVHCHSLYLYHSWRVPVFCRRFGVPYLIRPHGTLDPFIRRRHRLKKAILDAVYQQAAYRHAAALHYTTAEEQRLAEPAIKAQVPGVVIPNGLDAEAFAPLPPRGAFRARHPEIGDRTLLLFLSRINFKKGLDVLAQALGRLRARRPAEDWHLVLAGPDNEGLGTQVRAWLQEAGVLERVTFTGMVLGEEKRELLADADLFVLPSYSENFGIAVVEAAAAGLPLVISDAINIAPEAKAAGAALVSPAGDAEAVAADLMRLLDDADERQALAAAAQPFARRYEWDRIAVRLEEVYEGAVEGGR